MGFAEKWRQLGGDDGEDVKWEGFGNGMLFSLFCWVWVDVSAEGPDVDINGCFERHIC